MVALIIGTLENENGCLIIRGEHDAKYTLVWPADISAKIDGDKVKIVNGLVRGNPTEIQLTIGGAIYMSGGVAEQLSPELVNTIPNK